MPFNGSRGQLGHRTNILWVLEVNNLIIYGPFGTAGPQTLVIYGVWFHLDSLGFTNTCKKLGKVPKHPPSAHRRLIKHTRNACFCIFVSFFLVLGHLAGEALCREEEYRDKVNPSPLECSNRRWTDGRLILRPLVVAGP